MGKRTDDRSDERDEETEERPDPTARMDELAARLTAEPDEEPRSQLTDDELAELRQLLVDGVAVIDASADAAGRKLPEHVEAYRELGGTLTAVKAEEARRAEEQAQIAAEADEQRAAIAELIGDDAKADDKADDAKAKKGDKKADEGEPAKADKPAKGDKPKADEGDDAPVADGDQGDDGDTDEPKADEGDAEQIAASAQPARRPFASISALNAARPPAAAPERAVASDVTPRAQLLRDTPGYSFGSRLDRDELGDVLIATAESFGYGRGLHMPPAPRELVTIARMFPGGAPREPRVTSSMSPHDVNEVIEPVVAAAKEHGTRGDDAVEAITAAGGICALPEVRYDMVDIGDARTPIGDMLPTVPAARGAITYPTPFSFHDVEAQTPEPFGSWSLATDTSPGAAVKQSARILCPTFVTAHVNANYQYITFGNFNERFYPELRRQYMNPVAVVTARGMEQARLAAIDAAATGRVYTLPKNLGTYRDLLNGVQLAATRFRNAFRTPLFAPLDAIMPEWVIDAALVDFTRQSPGDDTTDADRTELVDDIRRLANVNLTLTPDLDRIDTIPTTGGALPSFPATVDWYLFHPGAFIRLDGGTLDLGIIRDTTLIAKNDFAMFTEWWEQVALTGFAPWKLTQTVAADGSTSAPVDFGGGGAAPAWEPGPSTGADFGTPSEDQLESMGLGPQREVGPAPDNEAGGTAQRLQARSEAVKAEAETKAPPRKSTEK